MSTRGRSGKGSLLRAITDHLGAVGFHAIRSVESLCSPSALYSLLAPLARLHARFAPNRLRTGLFGKSIPREKVRKARENFLMSRLLEFVPERLTAEKWQGRCETTGWQHLAEARQRGRPVVFVSLHFGTYKLIPFWLRARGIPVVALVGGESAQRSRAKRMKDRLSPFPKLPTVLYMKDQLRGLIRILADGNVAFLTVDRETGRQIVAPIDEDWSFSMATGAVRLAAHCDAELIPVCMVDRGRWNFHLEIAPPVPREYLADGGDPLRVADYLLRQLLPPVRKFPELSTNYLLNGFRRRNPASES